MMRAAILTGLTLVTGCRGDGRPGSGTTSSATASGGPTTAVPPPSPAAPASSALVPVPPAIASQVKLLEVVRGLERPVLLTTAPGDPRHRMFLLEQHAGRIRVLEHGAVSPKPYLELTGLSTGNEQGLLGLAFSPQFATTGHFFVNYTAANKDTHIVEYAAAPTGDAADPKPVRELAHIVQPYSNHNGGNLVFGPDGKLYVGMGDGGSAGDPHRNGQNPTALLGKLLRFDVTQPAPTPELVHLGLRNPWRFWFDAPTGDLYIGDVGQDTWENVYVVGGSDHTQHNFGWNVVEGAHCFGPGTSPAGGGSATCDHAAFTPPVADYSHEEGCSITGGVTYRGTALPALAGVYFYADYCTTLVRSFRWQAGPRPTVTDHWDWKAALDPDGKLSQISSFGVDADGEVYVLSLDGIVWKLVPAG